MLDSTLEDLWQNPTVSIYTDLMFINGPLRKFSLMRHKGAEAGGRGECASAG